MFNSARTTIYAANYDPYGQVMAQYLPNATPSFGFTGQMTDASGLQYLRARYYDPSLGTFLSRDPVMGAMGLSGAYNGYSYALGNPTTLVDPTGEFPWLAALVVAGWFTRGAAVDIGMQMTLGGRGLHNLDLRSAVISGGIDVATGGLGTYAKGLGYSAKAINRLDFAADVALSAGADVALFGDDPLAALAGNAAFGAGGRAAAHQAGRGIRAGARRLGIGGGGGARASIGCRANSFSEDTTISTSEGDVMISEVEQGAKVYAYDEDTGEVGLYTVLDTIVHEDDSIAYVTIDGEVIETTPWHLFYTDEGWQEVEDLEAGDLVLSLDERYGVVEGVTIVAETQVMYDLTVEEVHTFAVGAGRWVVQNQNQCGIERRERLILELFSGPIPQINRSVPGYRLGESHVITADIQSYGNPHIVYADAANLRFDMNTFDEVFFTNPFNEALRDNRSAMYNFRHQIYNEAARVLRPNGHLIVSFAGDNKYAKVLKTGTRLLPEIRALGFNIVLPANPYKPNSVYSTLHPALRGSSFGRPDGDVTRGNWPEEFMRTLVLQLGG